MPDPTPTPAPPNPNAWHLHIDKEIPKPRFLAGGYPLSGFWGYLHILVVWFAVGVLAGPAILDRVHPHPPVPPAPVPPIPPGPVPPGPTPPTPVPPVPPVPPQPPAPIPAKGLRVLIVYESADLSKYPPAQMRILFDPALRAYLNSACPKGEDGKTPEYRIWDKDVDPSGDGKLWQEAMKLPRERTPWIVVSNGDTGAQQPLPDTADATLALIKKYEVK